MRLINFSAMRLLRSVLLTPFWFSMLAGGDGFKTPTKPHTTSSYVGRQECASSIAPNRSGKTLLLLPPSTSAIRLSPRRKADLWLPTASGRSYAQPQTGFEHRREESPQF